MVSPFMHAKIVAKFIGTTLLSFGTRIGWGKIALAAVVLMGAALGARAYFSAVPSIVAAVAEPEVEVRSVAELSAVTSPLSISGTVTSRSEASVRAETSGQVIRVSRSLGDTVSAGTVVAELENSLQRASVLQAQGAVDAAQANVDKVRKGTRTEQLAILQASLEAARSGAVNALLSAYTAVDSAIRGATDKMFLGPEGGSPNFNVFQPDSQLTIAIRDQRVALGAQLERQRARAETLTPSDDLASELSRAESELRTVRTYLDMLVRALNAGVPSTRASADTISAYLASATGARASINGSLSALAGARQGLETAQKNNEQGVTGAQPEDVAVVQAALKQAQGALAAARANLEKSIIRAPIGGTINSFSLKRGDYVSMGSPVLTVANNGSLEIIAYITEGDARDIAVGNSVSLDSGATGVVAKIAPALDPMTKKIEVRIGISDPARTLINGQSVLAQISRSGRAANARLTIPISSIKVEADRVLIFTVSIDSTLVAHEVTLGELLGDRIVITDGLSNDMRIVVDARGLREGQKVTVR